MKDQQKNLAAILLACSLMAGCQAPQKSEAPSASTTVEENASETTESESTVTAPKEADHKCAGGKCGSEKKEAGGKCGSDKKEADHKCAGGKCGSEKKEEAK
ncbi:MAG: hypothetical protein SFU25_08905 [Candidatus Caenarcaniphilales bacterium]|nr:hypothetical protein [Candidatus Caenarcaniphilales bacterium]